MHPHSPLRVTAMLAAVAAALSLAACGTPAPRQGATPAADTTTPSARTATVQRQALAPALYEVAYSERLDALFVASAGGFAPDAPQSRILRLDPRTLAVQQEILLPLKGFGLALDDAAGRLYVGHTVDAAITAVDVENNRVLGTVRLLDKKIINKDGREAYSHHLRQLVLDPANHRLYAPGLSVDVPSNVFVVDTRSFKLEKVIGDLGGAATGIALDPAGQRLFVSNLGGMLYTIDTRTLTLVRSQRSPADQPMNLAYDAAKRRLLITDQGSQKLRGYQSRMIPEHTPHNVGNRLVAIDADSGREVASVSTGDGPIAVHLDEPRRRVMVTNRESGTVSVVDADSLALLDTVSLPPHPNSLDIDTRRNTVYVTIKNDAKTPKTDKESVARLQY